MYIYIYICCTWKRDFILLKSYSFKNQYIINTSIIISRVCNIYLERFALYKNKTSYKIVPIKKVQF